MVNEVRDAAVKVEKLPVSSQKVARKVELAAAITQEFSRNISNVQQAAEVIGTQSHVIGMAFIAKRCGVARRTILGHLMY